MRKSGVSRLLWVFPSCDTDRLLSGEFPVADIKDIEWSSEAYDCLTIPKQDKDMLMALAESRGPGASTARFDDFVTGKGKGLNILLQYGSKFLRSLTC